jgi:hypothetical protein
MGKSLIIVWGTSRMYLEIHMWSPASIPTLGPTWYSHCTDTVYEVLPDKQLYIFLCKKRKWGWSGGASYNNLVAKKENTNYMYIEISQAYLTRHDLPVCSTNVDSSVEACLVVSIWYVTAKWFVGSYGTVVWTLPYFDTIWIVLIKLLQDIVFHKIRSLWHDKSSSFSYPI